MLESTVAAESSLHDDHSSPRDVTRDQEVAGESLRRNDSVVFGGMVVDHHGAAPVRVAALAYAMRVGLELRQRFAAPS